MADGVPRTTIALTSGADWIDSSSVWTPGPAVGGGDGRRGVGRRQVAGRTRHAAAAGRREKAGSACGAAAETRVEPRQGACDGVRRHRRLTGEAAKDIGDALRIGEVQPKDPRRRRRPAGPVERGDEPSRVAQCLGVAADEDAVAALVHRDVGHARSAAIADQPRQGGADVLGAGEAQDEAFEVAATAAVELPGQPLDAPDVLGVIGDDDGVGIGQRLDAAERGNERAEDTDGGVGGEVAQRDDARDDVGRRRRRRADRGARPALDGTRLRHDPPCTAGADGSEAVTAQHRAKQVPHARGRQRLGGDDVDRALDARIENDRAPGQARDLLGDLGDVDVAHVDDDLAARPAEGFLRSRRGGECER